MVNKLNAQQTTNPAASGALFYSLFWGTVGVYVPFINVYFVELGLTGREIGLLAAFVPFMTLTVSPLLASLADRFNGRVTLLRIALIGSIITYFLLGLPHATTFQTLLPLMLLQAIFYAPIIPVADTIITRMATRYQLNYGTIRLFGSLVFALTTIGFGYVWQLFAYRWMFVTAAVLLLPAILITTHLEEDPRSKTSNPTPIWQILRMPGISAVLLTTFLAGIGIGFAFTFDGIYMSTLGGNRFYVGLMFGLAAFFELPSMHLSQRLTGRFSERTVFLASLALMTAAMLGYVFSPTPAILLIFGAIRGIGFGLFFISSVQLINSLAPAEWLSTAQSLRQACTFGLAALIAGPLGGWLYDIATLQIVFILAAGAFLLAVLVVATSLKS